MHKIKNMLYPIIEEIVLVLVIIILNITSISAIQSENYFINETTISSGINTSSSNFILFSSIGEIIGNTTTNTKAEIGFVYITVINITKTQTQETGGSEPEPTPTQTTSSGGGGGGGASGSIPTPKEEPKEISKEPIKKEISVDTKKIIEDTRISINTTKTISIKNTGDEKLEVSINVVGIPADISTDIFTLQRGEEKQITITFISNTLGLYTGNIIIKADELEKIIPFSIGVESLDALFDISLDIPSEYEYITKGQDIKSQITLINVLGNTADVIINYLIKSLDGKLILEESETFAVEKQKSYVKSFKLPPNIESGSYVISAELRYGKSYAIASTIFEIVEPEKKTLPKNISFIIISLIISLIILYPAYCYIQKLLSKRK